LAFDIVLGLRLWWLTLSEIVSHSLTVAVLAGRKPMPVFRNNGALQSRLTERTFAG